MSEELRNKIVEFLEGVVHGPAGAVDFARYNRFLEGEARELLHEIEIEEAAVNDTIGR